MELEAPLQWSSQFIDVGLDWQPPIAQTKLDDVIVKCQKLAESQLLPAFFNISIISLKFAIKLVSLLSGRSSLFNEEHLHFVVMAPSTLVFVFHARR